MFFLYVLQLNAFLGRYNKLMGNFDTGNYLSNKQNNFNKKERKKEIFPVEEDENLDENNIQFKEDKKLKKSHLKNTKPQKINRNSKKSANLCSVEEDDIDEDQQFDECYDQPQELPMQCNDIPMITQGDEIPINSDIINEEPEQKIKGNCKTNKRKNDPASQNCLDESIVKNCKENQNDLGINEDEFEDENVENNEDTIYDWSPKIKKTVVPGKPRIVCIVKVIPVPVTKDGKPWKGLFPEKQNNKNDLVNYENTEKTI